MPNNKIKVGTNWLTIKNYKEPLIKITRQHGFGYWGTLLCTEDGEKIQCHICGQLYSDLAAHVRQGHKIPIQNYKEMFKLARSTALISETRRWQLKENMLEVLKKMTPEERIIAKARSLEKRKARIENSFPQRLETANKRGTCPDQLIAKIHEITKKLGKTPSLKEFVEECGTQRYKHLIFKVFGGWLKALEMAKLQPVEKELHSKGGKKYSREILIEYLIDFTLANKKLPTFTDFKRELLPSYDVYTRQFGTLENARKEAKLDELLKERNIKSTLGRWTNKVANLFNEKTILTK